LQEEKRFRKKKSDSWDPAAPVHRFDLESAFFLVSLFHSGDEKFSRLTITTGCAFHYPELSLA
jgi:hypothetical protein